MSDTLFDTTNYGEPKPPKRKPGTATIPTEPLVAGWTAVRNRHGVLPFFHLIKVEDPAYATVVTLCGSKGSRLTNVGVDYMVRCPLCDAASQF